MTTPGGIPNLPIGALTLETMQSKLQDMSGAAMRSRAGERFPSIMGGSSGGNPLLDITPFGILTRIWAEFNSAVANADPADINGPEDLPALLLSFIENLPVVGEFVGLLEAILGTYDGDDPTLLQIQALFGFLRSDGMIDASKLFGELPDVIVESLRGLVGAVLDPGWLANIVPGQVGSGWSENLLTNPLFDGAVSLISEAGWEHDAAVFPAGALGSAKVVADGSRKVLSNKIIRGSEGQTVRAGGLVEWDGPAATVGDAFTVELRPFTAAGVELASVVVAAITDPASSSGGGWHALTADVPWPAGAAWVRTRIAVEDTVPVGTVVRWSALETRKGGFMPQDRIKDLPDDLADLVDRFLGVGNALNGFLRGLGAPSSGGAADPVLDWVRDALGLFTNSTNATATTADQAHGVGSNALTNTVAIQAQVQSLVERQDAGWSARPLWGSMDFTADATFPKHLMVQEAAHSHSTPAISGSTGSEGGSVSISISGTTSTETAGGSSHSHSFSGSDFESISHTHSFTAASGFTGTAGGTSITPATVSSSAAYLGYIRCGSVQEKRLFTFLAQASGTVSTFNLDVYRMAADGGLTLVYSSASFAGAITGALAWVQHTIPTGTASVTVAPGDILAIQLRMTGTGSVALGGITTPLPLNPPGWLPLRESAVRNPSTPAPATIAAATANASHTSTAIPYIEAGIDTGLAAAPITITDNFDGTLSTLWLMQGPNTLGITSNQLGIVDGNSDGYSWGTFRQRVSTDNMKVGFSVSSPTDREQIVWFHGRDRDNHVGLAITSSYATLYTMSSGSRTNRTQVAIGTVAASYEIRVSGTSYSIWRNGAQIGSVTITSAPSGRAGGVGLQAIRTGWFGALWYGANPIDNWLLADI